MLAVLLAIASISNLYAETIADAGTTSNPCVNGRALIDGIISDKNTLSEPYKTSDVYGCCPTSNLICSDTDQSSQENSLKLVQIKIGSIPQFTKEDSLHVLSVARKAWDNGFGTWPQMSLNDRMETIEKLITELTKSRDDIVTILMWEIGKNRKDAESEFDRTMSFMKDSIAAIRNSKNGDFDNEFQTIGSTRAFSRKAAIGIIMCLGPYNYPLNETYATLIPALLTGNIVIMKVPTIGGLVHLVTMDAFSKILPPGTINLISGSGRTTMPPLMDTGHIDGLAFIGGSSAADALIRHHPEPHRLKLFLQLEAKNMGIFLPDLFEPKNEAILDQTISEALTGALCFNGQRCTALKLLFVPSSHSEEFANRLAAKMESMRVGLPWQKWEDDDGKVSYSEITPLPNLKRISYMKTLITDAVSKGAKIQNKNGGEVLGGDESTLMIPALLHPVDDTMELYHDEQFGPIIPIAPYDDIDTVLSYGKHGKYGQQCSIFTAKAGDDLVSLVDMFSSIFGKINLNTLCARSPDTLAFSGRRSSAQGVMSIEDALREFSIPTVVAYKKGVVDFSVTEQIANEIRDKSNFMQNIV